MGNQRTQFVNRTKALGLYRQFIRATKSLGDAQTRWETMAWIRNDFERNRHVVESVRSHSITLCTRPVRGRLIRENVDRNRARLSLLSGTAS